MSPPPAPEAKVHIGNLFSRFSLPHHSQFDAGRPSGGGMAHFGFGGPQRAATTPGSQLPPGLQGKDSFTPFKRPSNPPISNPADPPGPQGDGVAWIGQMNPAGADASYKNAAENCGPAVMAMLARKKGLDGGTSDAKLITDLGKIGGTSQDGTTGNGLIAMANQMGLKSEAKPGADSQWVMSQLAQGKQVVANGNYYSLPQHADPTQNSPHYVLLTGIDPKGNIMVEDPMDPKVETITPQQLDQFNNGQPQGGFNIAFG